MNANSKPQTPRIKSWLTSSTDALQSVGIDSARLDSELILANVLGKNRTYLHAHDDEKIRDKNLVLAENYLNRRINREPLAYILGYKDFYGHRFVVTPNTLIPRPESETIIGILKQILSPNSNSQIPIASLVDVGTGSGCLGIIAKLLFPHVNTTLIDVSNQALMVAEKNAKKLGADIKILNSDLLENYNKSPDIIVANLPYVDTSWRRSPETSFEPNGALFAPDKGLKLIKKLISQSAQKIKPGGYLILEADPCQHDEIIKCAIKKSFEKINQNNYILVFRSNRRAGTRPIKE
jgi:release factor glutamine methyltransferase